MAALLLGGGCTEPPIGDQGAGRLQGLPPPFNDAGELVDAEASVANLPGLCIPDGVICHKDSDCCNGPCSSGGFCLPSSTGPFCAPDSVVCVLSTDCCDGYCGMGVCGATPSPGCVPEGIICHQNADCCHNGSMDAGSEGGSEGGSGGMMGPVAACIGGTPTVAGRCCGTTPGVPNGCSAPAPLCVPYGVGCTVNSDCCVGVCTLNGDLKLVCDIPPT